MAEFNVDKTRVLIVEDNRPLAENLFEFLGDKYCLDFAADGLTGLHLISANTYDVIVLDVMLPGINGCEICRRVRHDLKADVPIIMLTAKVAIEDKVAAFSGGADDYLTKPFDMLELELRINALHRRQSRVPTDQIDAGDLSYRPGTLHAYLRDGRTLALSGISATLFEVLIQAYPNYVTYETLCQRVWGEDLDIDLNVLHLLRTHVYALRKSLKEAFARDMIKTFHGRGYRLQAEVGR